MAKEILEMRDDEIAKDINKISQMQNKEEPSEVIGQY